MTAPETPMPGENDDAAARGIEAPQATDSTGNADEGKATTPSPEDIAAKAERAAELEKELQKVTLERNMLKNKMTEAEQAAEEARKAALEEQGDWKSIAEEAQRKLDEREAAEAAAEEDRQMRQVRQEAIDSYADPKVKAAAQKLVEKNDSSFWWGAAEDKTDAIAKVHAQLDTFKEVLGITSEDEGQEGAPEFNANNPGLGSQSQQGEASLEEMEKKLANEKF